MAVSRLSLIGYAAPAIFLAALYLPLYTYVTPFYVAERGVSLAAIGAAWIAIRLFDAVSDPAIGWLSDRSHSRWGRRRIWLVASVPLICIATWQAFVPPDDAGLGHAVFWLFLLTLGWTMAQTPYTAWGAEMVPDYDGRVRVTSWREAMVLFGTVLSTLIYFLAGEGGSGLMAVALAVAIGLPVTVGAAAYLAPEPKTERKKGLAPRAALAALRANQPFRLLLLAWFINGAANALPATLFLFFVSDRLLAPDMAGLLVLIYFLSAILGVPFWAWLARKTSKHRAWGVAMIYVCAIFLAVLALGPGDILLFGIISVLTGFALGADLALPPAIQADVVELDTAQTGAERAGLFFALWQVATKAALALSSGIALILLGLVGFEAGGENGSTALWTLTLLYGGAPVVLKLIAVALMWNFELDRGRVHALSAQA